MKKIKVRGKFFYEDAQGNLINSIYVKEEPIKVGTPKDILPILTEERTSQVEQVFIITLDGNNQIIKKHLLTKGTANQSMCHPRDVFRLAILDNACSFILAHNHPSGNLTASEHDLVMTKRINECCKTMGITMLDHVIVSALKHSSLRENYPNYFI